MKVFGGTGDALIPLLANLDEFRRRARESGGVINTADQEAAAAFATETKTLWEALRGLFFQVGLAAAQALAPIVQFLTPLVKQVRDFVSQNRTLVAVLLGVAAAVAAIGAALVVVGTAVVVIGALFAAASAIASFWAALAPGAVLAAALAAALVAAVSALVAGLVAGVVWFFKFTDVGRQAFAVLSAGFAQLWAWVRKVFGGIWDALVAGDWGLAASIAWLAIKLAWIHGLQALEKLWLDFRDWFLRSLAGMLLHVPGAGEDLAAQVNRARIRGRRTREKEMQADLAAARQALDDAIQKAAEARAAAFPEEARREAAAGVGAASQFVHPADGSSQGTFSARAAGLLSRHAGDAQDDIADNTERTADGVEDLVRLARDGGLVWT
jgi:hypothetical protein